MDYQRLFNEKEQIPRQRYDSVVDIGFGRCQLHNSFVAVHFCDCCGKSLCSNCIHPSFAKKACESCRMKRKLMFWGSLLVLFGFMFGFGFSAWLSINEFGESSHSSHNPFQLTMGNNNETIPSAYWEPIG
eukprot:TRINITY_DN1842_c0_g1_i1.p1 TRINITY_DN1842_c0_g1~~TRINITY_DN1842_c0_g1_i1.p1  ORF type:complete len:130 (-),score=39.03 TRINITY_DN1842_c0_g1_i1:255-644(-)